MKKPNGILFATALVLIFASGCAQQKAWVYQTNSYSGTRKPIARTAAVLPFRDARENLNKNRILLYMIPLIPGFGWADYQVPEAATMHISSGLWMNYKPTEDFAKALTDEIVAAGLFKEVIYDPRGVKTDLVIQGAVLDTRYKGTMISYGLSVYGPLLWFFGFPAGTVSNDLAVQITVKEAETNKILLSKTYAAPRYKKISWIYYMPSDFNYAAMLKALYLDAVNDLRRSLAAQ